ncbi:MAG: hypothetical protein WC451_02530 [Patescibacteria group bacterium]|jgi:tetratricopeptide (TPR) repeat protein
MKTIAKIKKLVKKYPRYAVSFLLITIMIVTALVLHNISDRKFAERKDNDLLAAYNYAESGKLDESIKLLEKRHDFDPNDKSISKQLAIYYFQAKKYDQFEKIVNEAKLEVAQIYTMKAFIARGAGEEGKALEYYNKAIELQPRTSNNYVDLANYYQILGRTGDALNTIKNGLNYNPKSSILNLLAANYSLELADLANAKIYAEKTLQIDEDNKRAIEIIGMK